MSEIILRDMKKLWFLGLCVPLFLFASGDHVVTYDKGSRFGDNLLSYLHAKWIAYQYDLPLRYKPFKHSSGLVLHQREVRLSQDPRREGRLVVGLENGPVDGEREGSVMYVCPYFPEDPLERQSYYHFDVDWKNREFRQMVRELIAPQKKLALVKPPKHTVNIAIHVREGGGFDPESTKIASPLKLPPMSFYQEGLAKIVSLFPGQKIFCHVFTDALEPQKMVKALQEAVPPSVKFGYRTSNNSHKHHVLEDFFSFFEFDVLIRPQSHFSMIPSLIHDYAIVYHPVTASCREGPIVIDETSLQIDEGLYQQLLLKKGAQPRWIDRIWDFFRRSQ